MARYVAQYNPSPTPGRPYAVIQRKHGEIIIISTHDTMREARKWARFRNQRRDLIAEMMTKRRRMLGV